MRTWAWVIVLSLDRRSRGWERYTAVRQMRPACRKFTGHKAAKGMTRATYEVIRASFLGLAVGDALGVPVEFKSRDELRRSPITGMTGYGSFNQPPGTFSDDSSLTFCMAEALIDDFDTARMAGYFVRWFKEGYWSARGTAFD